MCVAVQQLLPVHTRDHLPAWLPGDFAAIALGILIEIPLCVWGNFNTLSNCAAAGVLSTAVVTVLVVVLPILDPNKQCLAGPSEHRLAGGSNEVFAATGIMAVR